MIPAVRVLSLDIRLLFRRLGPANCLGLVASTQ
jgi:hypothetical protein